MSFSLQRRTCAIGLASLGLGSLSGASKAWAQAAPSVPYPNRPLRVVIPFPPGGAIDTLMRMLAPDLERQFGVPVVIFNKPGGGSQIAAADMLSSPADGHTLFVGQIGDFTVNSVLYKTVNYLPSRDFDEVAMLVSAPQVMVANVAGRFNKGLGVRQVLSTPGETFNYGSFGPGTAPHLLGHMLGRQIPQSTLVHVPYKGFPPASQALQSQEIDLLFDAVPGALNMMKTGRVIPIAVASPRRSPYLPDVPTTAEIGFPSLVMDFWVGVSVRKGTPAAIIDRLHDAFQASLAAPETSKRLTDWGYSTAHLTTAQFDEAVKKEADRIKPVILDTGVVVD